MKVRNITILNIALLYVITISCDKVLSPPFDDSIFQRENHSNNERKVIDSDCFSNDVSPLEYARNYIITTGAVHISVVSEEDALIEIKGPRLRSSSTRRSYQSGIVFRYLGVSEEQHQFTSGAVRTQIALRVLYENSCNTYYVVWVLEPEEKLIVTRKYNPGENTSSECGADGYETISVLDSIQDFPVMNSAHDLGFHTIFTEVELSQTGDCRLTICCDGHSVADIILPERYCIEALPNGVRTDNGVFRFIPFGGAE